MANRDAIAHLLRRATFGPTADEVDAAERLGLDATLDQLLAPRDSDTGAAATPAPALDPDPYAGITRASRPEERSQAAKRRTQQAQQLVRWWVDRMVTARHQLGEKLVFFWHGHWATDITKVKSPQLMLGQLDTFRRYGQGDFAVLVQAMVHDPALVYWLDGQQNTRAAPNENLARELMELFTLGIGNYTEADVKAGARALTGWTVSIVSHTTRFTPKRHDPDPKTILGRTADFDADSFAALLTAQPRAAAFLAERLWFRFASDTLPAPATAAHGDVTATLRAIFTDPAFAQTRGQLVKQPVEWAVGAMRQLGVRPSALTASQAKQLRSGLRGMGQEPLRPPSVGGWPAGLSWLTTASLLARIRLADLFATAAAPEVRHRLTAAPAAGRLDALARLLVVDGWTDRTRSALTPLAGDPRRLISAALVSPEYAVG